MARFIHAADLQLGLKHRKIIGDKGARARAQRFDTVEKLAALAKEHAAEAVVVAGDVFDSNAVGPDLIQQARDVFAKFGCPVLLLPGNHDFYEPQCALQRLVEGQSQLSHVQVLSSTEPITIGSVTYFPCPLLQRHTYKDPTAHLADRQPGDRSIRVAVAHGGVHGFDNDSSELANLIDADSVAAKGFDYLALGDWHSLKKHSSRAWYPGAHEATRFKEVDPGYVLLVDIPVGGALPEVASLKVNRTQWHKQAPDFTGQEDIQALQSWYDDLPEKSWSAVELRLSGVLSIAEHNELERLLERMQEELMYLRIRKNETQTRPSDEELAELELPGFLSSTFQTLSETSAPHSDEAIRLFHRLLVEEQSK